MIIAKHNLSKLHFNESPKKLNVKESRLQDVKRDTYFLEACQDLGSHRRDEAVTAQEGGVQTAKDDVSVLLQEPSGKNSLGLSGRRYKRHIGPDADGRHELHRTTPVHGRDACDVPNRVRV